MCSTEKCPIFERLYFEKKKIFSFCGHFLYSWRFSEVCFVTGLDLGALCVQMLLILMLVLRLLSKIKLTRDVTLFTGRVATGVLKQFGAFNFGVKESWENSLKSLRFSETSELLTSDTWYISEDFNINNAWYCRDRVSSCNIYAVQQDTQSVVMSKFIQHLC